MTSYTKLEAHWVYKAYQTFPPSIHFHLKIKKYFFWVTELTSALRYDKHFICI
jgi:hypothetical protein